MLNFQNNVNASFSTGWAFRSGNRRATTTGCAVGTKNLSDNTIRSFYSCNNCQKFFRLRCPPLPNLTPFTACGDDRRRKPRQQTTRRNAGPPHPSRILWGHGFAKMFGQETQLRPAMAQSREHGADPILAGRPSHGATAWRAVFHFEKKRRRNPSNIASYSPGLEKWCAVQVSNLRPLPCQGSALPLS